VDILFGSTKLRKTCTSGAEAVKVYGPEGARRLRIRLDDMAAAPTLAVLGRLPQARCHELTGDRKGQLAVDLKHPYRLVFKPANNSVPLKPDGGLDWAKVTAITIIEVVDYHG
jgi:plasmid maintenance system killer protein